MLALKIALRYLIAPKSHKAVNIISIIALAGVAVATAAIIVVLSVFNGFSELSRQHLSYIDPDLKVLPVEGKVFSTADSLCRALETNGEIISATPTIEERALAVGSERQQAVILKGVIPAEYEATVPFAETIIDGSFVTGEMPRDAAEAAALAVGVANGLRVRPGFFETLDLYVPRRTGRINPANPSGAYRSVPVTVSGVFRVDQPEYDADYIVTDINLLRELLEYSPSQAGAIELKLREGVNPDSYSHQIEQQLGNNFRVLTRERQQPETFRMISVEKWVTFLMMIFILVIACFNIISTLSLLVIEKRDNMRTLRALGAPHSLVSSIFAWEGTLITAIGGLAGIAFGVLLAWFQEHFSIIKLDADPTALSIAVYPVHIEWTDVAATAGAIILLGLLIGQLARFFTRKIQ